MEEFINSYKCLDCNHCFKKSSAFKLLNTEQLETINNARMEVDFKKGEIIYKQGTPLTHIVILHSGFGKVYIEGDKGRNLILNYTKLYDINGGVGIFVDQRHHSSLMAITDCSACFIEIDIFKSVLRRNAAFMESYLKEHSERVLHTYHQFSVLTQKNMEGRMAEAIKYLNCQPFNNGSISSVSRQDLAEMTAMTKESAIRVLKEFKDDGIIEMENNIIKVLNEKALEQITHYG
jgi:CRP/FNR family transcriptional regulator